MQDGYTLYPLEDACKGSAGQCDVNGTGTSYTTINRSSEQVNSSLYLQFNVSGLSDTLILDENRLFLDRLAGTSGTRIYKFAIVNNSIPDGSLWLDQFIEKNEAKYLENATLYPTEIFKNQASWYNERFEKLLSNDINSTVDKAFSYIYENTGANYMTFWMRQSEDVTAGTDRWSSIEAAGTANDPFISGMEKLYRTVRFESNDTQFIYYDFESNTVLASNDSTIFDSTEPGGGGGDVSEGFDFGYDTRNNKIKPFAATGSQRSVGFDIDDDSDLHERSCAGLSFTTDTGIAEAEDIYVTSCFQLKDQHNGSQFFGLMKVVNSTEDKGLTCSPFCPPGRDVEIFLTLVSPDNFAINFNKIIPENPLHRDNVQVLTTTTKNATHYVQYRFADFDANISNLSSFSTWFTVNSTPNSTQFSGVELDNFTVVRFPAMIANVIQDKYYQFFVYAIDNDGNIVNDTNSGVFYNFSVGASQRFEEGNATGYVPVMIERLCDNIGCELSEGIYLFGFLILAMVTLLAWKAGGMELGLGGFLVGMFAFSIIGLLPIFLVLPLLLIIGLVVARFITSHIKGGGK